jgi:hypothetical protein
MSGLNVHSPGNGKPDAFLLGKHSFQLRGLCEPVTRQDAQAGGVPTGCGDTSIPWVVYRSCQQLRLEAA